jgi:hypothetical protein
VLQDLADEAKVAGRQWIFDDVEAGERDAGRGVVLAVVLDQAGDDVEAGADAEVAAAEVDDEWICCVWMRWETSST